MAEYYYLVSSLPMIMEEEVPQLLLDQFLDMCASWLPESDMDSLCNLSLVPDIAASTVPGWTNWEICLRNRMAILRGSKLERESDEFLEDERDSFSEIERGVQEAFARSTPLEKERELDAMRWRRINDLESGHNFDFTTLCLYKLKLMLNAKWLERQADKGEKHLEMVLEHVYGDAGAVT